MPGEKQHEKNRQNDSHGGIDETNMPVTHEAIAFHQMSDGGRQNLDTRQYRIKGARKCVATARHRRADYDNLVANRIFLDIAVQDLTRADRANSAAGAIKAKR